MTGRKALISLAVIGATLAAHAQSAGELLRSGDALDARHRNQEALAIYLKADAIQPDDAEILRRIAGR